MAPSPRRSTHRHRPGGPITDHAPDDGHTFRITFDVRGSSKVVGDPHFTDAPAYSGLPHTIEVRAWSLLAALRKALDTPFAELMGEETAGEPYSAEALRAAAREFREVGGPTWGGDRTWFTTGTRVADLVASWLEESADTLERTEAADQ